MFNLLDESKSAKRSSEMRLSLVIPSLAYTVSRQAVIKNCLEDLAIMPNGFVAAHIYHCWIKVLVAVAR